MVATEEIKIEKALKTKWNTVKLGELLDKISNGYGGTQIQEKNVYPITRIETISNSTIDLDRVRYAKSISEAEIEKYKLIEGDLLFSHINSDHHLGKTAIYKNQCGPLIQGINLLLLRPNKKVISPYLNYVLNYIRWKGEFIKIAQHAVNQSSLNQSKIKNVDIPLPSIPEQHRIVEKIEELFSELDYAIATLKATQRQLQTYRQSVLKHAFEGHFTGGMKGWKNVRLADVADIKGGVTKGKKLDGKTTIELPYLRVANVQDGYLDLSEIKFIKVLDTDLEKYRLLENDILFTEGGDKDKLGRGTIWKNQIKDCIHQNHIFRARVKKDVVLPKFLEYVTKTQKSRAYFYKVAKQTTNLASINMTQLSNLEFDMPPLKFQETIISEIETRLSESDYLLQTINEQLVKAERLRQSILQRAFSGELV